MQHCSGSHWALDFEVVAIVAVKPPQRFDNQRVHRHPDRTPPMRVAAKYPGGRFCGVIADGQPSTGMLEDIGMLLMEFGQRADPEFRQKQRLVEHSVEQTLHPMSAEQ